MVDTALGTFAGDILLIGAFVAIFGACLAVQAAGARIMFGMARDHQLPQARRTASVSKKTRAIVWPTLAVGVLAIVLLAINIKSTQIIPIISSAAIATAQIAYLFVTVPLLVPAEGHMAAKTDRSPLVFARPPRPAGELPGGALGSGERTQPAVALLYIGLVLVVGTLYYLRSARSNHEVLPEHRSASLAEPDRA